MNVAYVRPGERAERKSVHDRARRARWSGGAIVRYPPILADTAFPIIVSAHPSSAGPTAVANMLHAYEANFAKARRFAFITRGSPGNGVYLTPRDRLAIAEWANTARVRELTRRWVVCSVAIVGGRIERGTMTALLWLWTSPSPHLTCGTSKAAVDFCIEGLKDEGLLGATQASALAARAMEVLEAETASVASCG